MTYLKLTKTNVQNAREKCELIGFKNDRLRYRCKKCKKGVLSQKMDYSKSLCAYINFAMLILINLFYC